MIESPIPSSEKSRALNNTFALVAGEASGDQLGASLMNGLRELFPGAKFCGIGGPLMTAAGLEAWYPAEKLSVMGLVEVLGHLPELLAIRRDVARRVIALQPDAFIGIDAPDFNLGLERKLKRRGLRTVHYVSPSVWAWKEKRARTIGRSADMVLCLFPMEPAIYARHGVNARFVGHPLADTFAVDPDRAAARHELNLPNAAPVLALLPGSRLGEIRRLAPDFLAAAVLIEEKVTALRVVVPLATAAGRAEFDRILARFPENAAKDLRARTTILDGNAHTAMIAADAVLVASGTAALEAMLAKRPMVVAYRLAALTYWLVTRLRLMKVTRYSLPNVLAGRELVAELMQDDCTPESLAAALLPYLDGSAHSDALLAEFRQLHASLHAPAGVSAAAAIADLIRAVRAD
ncbi:MAG: lipid-A-disaccharide synthase [Dokdonella sp.]